MSIPVAPRILAVLALAGGLCAAAPAANAAPLAVAPVASETGLVTVQYGYGYGHGPRHFGHHGWGHRRHFGHRHGWGHRHHGWGHHRGWGHRHHGWGHGHHRGW